MTTKNAWSSNIDILIGATSEEGLFYKKFIKIAPEFLKGLQNLEKVVPAELNLDRNSVICKQLGSKLKQFYYGEKDTDTETDSFYMVI